MYRRLPGRTLSGATTARPVENEESVETAVSTNRERERETEKMNDYKLEMEGNNR